MRTDGKAIAASIKETLKARRVALSKAPRVLLVYAGDNPVIDSYIAIKERFAAEVGVIIEVARVPNATTEELVQLIESSDHDGIVVQLPLPPHISSEAVINAVPLEKDIDANSNAAFEKFKSGEGKVFPPVPGAVREVIESVGYDLEGKRVAIVGKGKLVGRPVGIWFENQGITPTFFEKGDDLSELREMDLIVSGAGSAHIITSDLVREGVFLIDAGTSVEEGVAKGDIDPACEALASFYSGVPGGIGPITIAILFRNLFDLVERATSTHS